MNVKYFPPTPGGRWTTGLIVSGRFISLVQDSYLDDEGDAKVVLTFLGIPPTNANLDFYFPERRGTRIRCPTLDLLELAASSRERRVETGV